MCNWTGQTDYNAAARLSGRVKPIMGLRGVLGLVRVREGSSCRAISGGIRSGATFVPAFNSIDSFCNTLQSNE